MTGSLVEAVRKGHWVLLDEINLASAETLESLSSLFEGGSISLNERGDVEPIERHPELRIFACMNPGNDAGKKELPPGLRGRFTEFYVEDIYNEEDLRTITTTYLQTVPNSARFVKNIVSFYLAAQEQSKVNLADGANHRPHYSLRSLCRSLDFARSIAMDYGLERALYEGEKREEVDVEGCRILHELLDAVERTIGQGDVTVDQEASLQWKSGHSETHR